MFIRPRLRKDAAERRGASCFFAFVLSRSFRPRAKTRQNSGGISHLTLLV